MVGGCGSLPLFLCWVGQHGQHQQVDGVFTTVGIAMHRRVRTLVLHILRQLLQWRGLTEAANAALLQALLAAFQPDGPQANSSGAGALACHVGCLLKHAS